LPEFRGDCSAFLFEYRAVDRVVPRGPDAGPEERAAGALPRLLDEWEVRDPGR